MGMTRDIDEGFLWVWQEIYIRQRFLHVYDEGNTWYIQEGIREEGNKITKYHPVLIHSKVQVKDKVKGMVKNKIMSDRSSKSI